MYEGMNEQLHNTILYYTIRRRVEGEVITRPTILQDFLIRRVLLFRVVQCVGESVTATGPHAHLQTNLDTQGQKSCHQCICLFRHFFVQ